MNNVMQYFCFQGLWIFIIFSIRPVIVRRLWSDLLFKGKLSDSSQTNSRSWSQGTHRNTVNTVAAKSRSASLAPNVAFDVRSIGSSTKSEVEENSVSNSQGTRSLSKFTDHHVVVDANIQVRNSSVEARSSESSLPSKVGVNNLDKASSTKTKNSDGENNSATGATLFQQSDERDSKEEL